MVGDRWEDIELRDTALVLIDTTACDMMESSDEGSLCSSQRFASSKYNEGEASLVIDHVQRLMDIGVSCYFDYTPCNTLIMRHKLLNFQLWLIYSGPSF